MKTREWRFMGTIGPIRLCLFVLSILLVALIVSLSADAESGKDTLPGRLMEPQTTRAARFSVIAGATRQSPGDSALKRPKGKRLSARETKRILETKQHTLDEELSQMALCQAFDLAGGGVLLLYEDGKGILYESKDELLALADEVERESRQGPVSVCRDLPQGQAFVEQVPQLIHGLAARLHLDSAELDGSETSLNKVDKALRRLRPEQLIKPDVFAPLTAYVGEVMRKATNGRWEMRRGSDDETWEPWIVDPSGRSYAPFAIYKELLEYGKSASIRGFVAGTLGAWRLGEPAKSSR